MTGTTGDSGCKVGPRMSAASAMMASFCFWSSGTKLARLRTLSTVDSGASRVASRCAVATSGARMSIVNGLVSGEPIRSCRVRIASVFGFLVSRGLESKAIRGANSAPASAITPNPASNGRRQRRISGSSGTAQAKPTIPRSPVGRNRAIAPGRKAIVQAKAINMPTPAISPSSATPLNAVGTKARNPAAVATAATRICSPTRAAVRRMASAGSAYSNRRSR